MEPIKPGYKTSEFWVTAVTSLLTLINQSGVLGSVVLPVESIAVIGGMVATYVLSRGMAKKPAKPKEA